jgi:hypothetical protein
MSDWAIKETPIPYAFIQWKGTDVCADYHCLCGMFFHLDSDFAYAVQCPSCNRRYEVSAHVELREMPNDEEWDGCDVKVGTDATPDSWEDED